MENTGNALSISREMKVICQEVGFIYGETGLKTGKMKVI
jgi:hypothetical protein